MTESTKEVEITPEMTEAGVARLYDLLEAQVGLSYAAEEVFRVMRALESPKTP